MIAPVPVKQPWRIWVYLTGMEPQQNKTQQNMNRVQNYWDVMCITALKEKNLRDFYKTNILCHFSHQMLYMVKHTVMMKGTNKAYQEESGFASEMSHGILLNHCKKMHEMCN